MTTEGADKTSHELLALAADGAPLPRPAGERDFDRIRRGLRSRKLIVYFPSYFTHEEVDGLESHVLKHLTLDDVLWYLDALMTEVGDRYPRRLHWVEVCNLYQTFGLVRLATKQRSDAELKAAREVIERALGARRRPLILSLADVSAYSALACIDGALDRLTHRSMRDWLETLVASAGSLKAYGNYQLHYHGGLKRCLQEQGRYSRNERNQIFAPQTVVSLMALKERMQPRFREDYGSLIQEGLTESLGRQVQQMVFDLIRRMS